MPRTYIREFQAAVQDSQLPGIARGILLGMAVWADYDSGKIGPEYTRSLSGIVAATGQSRASVAKYLGHLDDAGWLIRHIPTKAQQRGGMRTWYELRIGKPELLEPP